MDWYPWLVFVHVASGFLFALAHGVSAGAALRIRSERERSRVTALLDLSSSSLGVLYGALLLILGTGITLGFMGGHWGRLWIWTSLGLFVAITISMYAVGSNYYTKLRRAVGQVAYGDPKGTLPPEPVPDAELAAMLASPRPFALAAIGGIGLALIVWLMLFKPF